MSADAAKMCSTARKMRRWYRKNYRKGYNCERFSKEPGSTNKTQRKSLVRSPVRQDHLKKDKRCPRGSRRNKKTRECVKNVGKSQIKSVKRVRSLVKVDTIDTPANTSVFSPSINRDVTERVHTAHVNPFGCGLEGGLVRGSPNYRKSTGKMRVRVGVKKDGTNKCVGWATKSAQDIMLRNMNLETIDCSSVTAPVQKHSNCWFNCMFMSFFVSDKGRKFFKFFRQQMVKGTYFIRNSNDPTKFETVPIKPPALAKSFFLLNAAVDASLFGKGNAKNPGLLMDTNNLIAMIYKSLSFASSRLKGLRDSHESGNPLNYYKSIVEYLGGDGLYSSKHALRILETDNVAGCWDGPDLRVGSLGMYVERLDYAAPDVIVIEQDDKMPKTLNSHFTENFYGQPITYKLDSIVVRDVTKRHFCTLLTCNGKSFGFDGASLQRMTSFDWRKRALDWQAAWSFKGSVWGGTNKSIIWKMSRAYAVAFYYRTSPRVQ
jgi:hypothetical protein